MRQLQFRSYLLMITLGVALAACGTSTSIKSDTVIQASGFIEGRVYTITSTTGGFVEEVYAEQGMVVERGQPLVQLDGAALERAREQAQAGVDAAFALLQALEKQPTEEALIVARAAVDAAEANLTAANAGLELLISSYDPLDPPDEDLHIAEAAIMIAKADLDLAYAELAQVEAGSPEGELQVARMVLEEARANHRLIELQLLELTLVAPSDGVVSQVMVRVGEVAQPGSPLVQVRDPSILTLTLFVPETQIAKIDYGDEVTISVDAFGEETFHGWVKRIADQAQFTPSSVQTQEERVKLVFAVEVMIDDPSGRLIPGIPADARILQ